jgi:hypothetical protein
MAAAPPSACPSASPCQKHKILECQMPIAYHHRVSEALDDHERKIHVTIGAVQSFQQVMLEHCFRNQLRLTKMSAGSKEDEKTREECLPL